MSALHQDSDMPYSTTSKNAKAGQLSVQLVTVLWSPRRAVTIPTLVMSCASPLCPPFAPDDTFAAFCYQQRGVSHCDPFEAFALHYLTVVVQILTQRPHPDATAILSHSACASTCHSSAGAPPPYPSHPSFRSTLNAVRSCLE